MSSYPENKSQGNLDGRISVLYIVSSQWEDEMSETKAHYDEASETYYVTRDGVTMAYTEGGEYPVDSPQGVEIVVDDLPRHIAGPLGDDGIEPDTYEIRYSDGRVETAQGYDAAQDMLREQYPDAEIGHDGDLSLGGDRTLAWETEEISCGDDGQHAVASIHRIS
jgi:hypothetical protein